MNEQDRQLLNALRASQSETYQQMRVVEAFVETLSAQSRDIEQRLDRLTETNRKLVDHCVRLVREKEVLQQVIGCEALKQIQLDAQVIDWRSVTKPPEPPTEPVVARTFYERMTNSCGCCSQPVGQPHLLGCEWNQVYEFDGRTNDT